MFLPRSLRRGATPGGYQRVVVALSVTGMVAISAAACSRSSSASADQGPMTVGSILDLTGDTSNYGIPMVEATKLAVSDINAHGGVLGRQLVLNLQDGQSDVSKYTVEARSLASNPDVAVVIGGITGASREAIRPIFDSAKKLYFFAPLYEGGVCDKNTFLTGPSPTQQLGPLLKWATDKGLKKWYVVAANYIYGTLSAQWVQVLAKQYGAEIVGGPTFFDLNVSNFSDQLPKIQASGADTIVSLMVGSAQENFYKQWAATGLNKSTTIVSTSFGFGSEQVSLGAAAKGIMTDFPYFQDLNTKASQAFVTSWHAAGYKDVITPGAESTWNAWHLWAKAVNKAGTTDRGKVLGALESGNLAYEAPSGPVTIDPPTHHVLMPMRLWQANGKGGFDMVSELTSTAVPTFERSVCNLIKNPDTNKEFTP